MRLDWKDRLVLLGVVLVGWLVGALAEYVGGRVLLPAMGLTAPGYWTWLWFTFWVIVFGIIALFVRSIFDD